MNDPATSRTGPLCVGRTHHRSAEHARWAVVGLQIALLLAAAIGTATTYAAVSTSSADPKSGQASDCSVRLQTLVDSVAPGDTLDLPACIYRESVTIDRPIHLVGHDTEIRGSDVWSVWRPTGKAWESDLTLPALDGDGECRSGADRCRLPEQIFMDGVAQARAAVDPGTGAFALTSDRHVLLGSDPASHVVEVSVRDRWLQVSASGVTVETMTFRHAANSAQAEQAALRVSGGVDDFTLLDSQLYEAHGTLLGIVGGSGHRVTDDVLERAGQQGFGFAGTSETEMRGTTVADNNLGGFDPGWEAGAGKASRVRGLTLADNVVVDNAGPGLWCDIDCESVTVTGNRIVGNDGPGIMFEISSGATISGNVVVDNGWGHADGGWGGGILVSSSGHVDVASNTLAWNADGVTVVSQPRGDRPTDSGTRITVHDNTVLAAPQPTDQAGVYLEAWIQDGSGPLFDPTSGNRGWNNRYWSTEPESATPRFAWAGDVSSLEAYGATPGGAGDRYLTAADKDAVLQAAQIPSEARPHQVTPSLGTRLRSLVIPALVGGLLVVGIAGLGVARWRRTRRSRRSARGTEPPG